MGFNKKFAFLCILLFLFFARTGNCKQNIVDLGVHGFTCDIDRAAILKNHNKHLAAETAPGISGRDPEVSFNLENKEGNNQDKQSFSLKDGGFLGEKTIYVFGAKDDSSIDKASEVNADFGICVDYDSLNDVVSFREKSGFDKPVILGTNKLADLLRIEFYPSLIHIKNGEIRIEME